MNSISPIRIGLLIDSERSPLWIKHMIELVRAEEGVKIVLVVRNDVLPVLQSKWRKIFAAQRYILYHAWRVLDRHVFSVSNDAFQETDLTALLKDVPVLGVIPKLKRFSSSIVDEDVERILTYKVDVFLRLGFGILTGRILEIAPCGIWSFHHGDNFTNRGGPAGVWEMLLQKPTTGSILQILTEELDGGRVLYRSWSGTNQFALNHSLNNLYWKSLAFVPRALRKLRRVGVAGFMKDRPVADLYPPRFYDRPLYRKPDNLTILRRLTPIAWKTLKRVVWKTRFKEQWMLLYAWGNPAESPSSMFRYKKLCPPVEQFWADPCVVEEDGKYVVFIEEFDHRKGKPHISVIEFNSMGEPQLPPRKILEKPIRLSYPFVFKDDDTWYMIPETQQSGTIELYRCTKFPNQWEFVMNLMENISAVDVTVWKNEERYWMFANISERDGVSSCDELFLYSSATLLTTNWTPHPLNPIVSDVRRSRPAGAIFSHNGSWYRPAQDCSGVYGLAIIFNRIDAISIEDYVETPRSRLEASWDPDIIRTHTYSRAGRLTVLDGLMKRRR